MADFKQGDRVVKMSGIGAGKYGTVNSVREDGTLNVTFDGEKIPKYCDPERCGKVAANARTAANDIGPKWGQLNLWAKTLLRDGIRNRSGYIYECPAWHVKDVIRVSGENGGRAEVVQDNIPGKVGYSLVKITDPLASAIDHGGVAGYNSRAANAKFKVGDRVVLTGLAHTKGSGRIVRWSEDRHQWVVDLGGGDIVHVDERNILAANSLAANVKFKVGDRVRVPGIGKTTIKDVEVIKSVIGDVTKYYVDIGGGKVMSIPERDIHIVRNSRNADTPEGRRFIERAKALMRGARDKTDLSAVRDRMVRELRGSAAIADDEKDGIEGELFQLHGEEVRRRGAANSMLSKRARNAKWRVGVPPYDEICVEAPNEAAARREAVKVAKEENKRTGLGTSYKPKVVSVRRVNSWLDE